MNRILSRDDLKSYLNIELGGELHEVEVSNNQYETAIDNCIQMFQRWNSGEGNYFQRGALQLQAGKSKYILREITPLCTDDIKHLLEREADLPNQPEFLAKKVLSCAEKYWDENPVDIEWVREVRGCGTTGIGGGGYNIFNPMVMLMGSITGGNPFFTSTSYWGPGAPAGNMAGGGIGGAFGTTGQGSFIQDGTLGASSVGATYGHGTMNSKYDPYAALGTYNELLKYMAAVEHYFEKRFIPVWRKDAGILELTPTPSITGTAVITYMAKENELYLYDNPLFKKLLLGYIMGVWASNLSKYKNEKLDMNKISTDGRKMYDDALTEIQENGRMPIIRRI